MTSGLLSPLQKVLFVCLFCVFFNRGLLKAYYVPGPALSTGITKRNKAKSRPLRLQSSESGQYINQRPQQRPKRTAMPPSIKGVGTGTQARLLGQFWKEEDRAPHVGEGGEAAG